MNLRTYDGLKTAVADYLGRGDLREQIPTFIAMAELRLNRDVRLRAMERRATRVVPMGTKAVSLPWKRIDGDWDVFMEMRDLAWLSDPPLNLQYMPPDEYVRKNAVQADPKGYTIVGRELLLCPAPINDGILQLTYYAEIPPLSDTTTTNMVLDQFPDLYLYASLVEAIPYTRSSAPAELWVQYYSAAKNHAETQEQRARFTANISMRPTRRV